MTLSLCIYSSCIALMCLCSWVVVNFYFWYQSTEKGKSLVQSKSQPRTVSVSLIWRWLEIFHSLLILLFCLRWGQQALRTRLDAVDKMMEGLSAPHSRGPAASSRPHCWPCAPTLSLVPAPALGWPWGESIQGLNQQIVFFCTVLWTSPELGSDERRREHEGQPQPCFGSSWSPHRFSWI